LRYGITDSTGLRLSWGRFFQSQAIHELQIADGVAGFYPPQRSDHWLAALEHRQSNGVDVRLEIYRKDYRALRPRFENLLNTFILLPELKPDRIRVAPERAVVKGAEISFGHRNGGPHSWWLSYTWSSAHDIVEGTKTPRNWDQTHSVSGGMSWHNDRWELSLAGLWHSGWPTTDLALIEAEPIPLVATGARNARRLGNYAALNARAERTFRFQRAGSLGVFLELSNLLNRANDCCVDYQIEDESEDLLLDIEPVDYLPALPSLGFVWRF
jgi:outer membrane cobalamin receptor